MMTQKEEQSHVEVRTPDEMYERHIAATQHEEPMIAQASFHQRRARTTTSRGPTTPRTPARR
jgi:hypothetical protein